ncbi:TIM barrel protein [bacterium]|nr:TIM barrel protein [bacterium]
MSDFSFSVFVKPWRELSLAKLAALVSDMGFTGVELPVRPGFVVNPDNARTALREAEQIFSEQGVSITSVAAAPNAGIVRACATCRHIPMIRDMAKIEVGESYLAVERRYIDLYRELTPLLLDCGVRIGLQNHNGRFISNAAGLRRVLDPLDPKAVGAVWDPAHCALAGELPDLAMDLLRDRLYMVNLKNAIMRRTTGPEATEVRWKHYWTAGHMGLAPWSLVSQELQQAGWSGVLTLCAEYADEHAVERLTREDRRYAGTLFPTA